MKRLNSLEFYNQHLIDNNIVKEVSHHLITVKDIKLYLLHCFDTSCSQLQHKRFLIH